MKKIDVHQLSPMGEIATHAWESDKFYAALFEVGGVGRLSFHRKDMTDGITWDEVQQLKHDCGYGDKDAMEFFPADDAVINTGNIRHIFIFDQPIPLVWRVHGKPKS